VNKLKLIPRHRFRGEIQTTLDHRTYQDQNTGPNVTSSGHNWPVALELESTTGYDVPEFHKRKNAGELIPHTPFEQFFATQSADGRYELFLDPDGPTFARSTINPWFLPSGYDNYWLWYDGQKVPPTIPTVAELKSHIDESVFDGLVQGASAKIYSKGHDSLTFVAEILKLKRMFVERAQKLLKNKRANPRKNKDLAKDLLKSSQDWLELRYGWRTLIYDLMDMNDALQEFELKRTRYSERVGYSVSSLSTIDLPVSGVSPMLSQVSTLDEYVDISYRGSVTADIRPPPMQANLLITGWELLPFSFIMDWFIGVGQWLASTSFLLLSSSHTASYGYNIVISRSYNMESTGWATNYSQSDLWFEINSRTELSVRVPTTVSLLPQVSVNLDAFKVVDLAALLMTRFKYGVN